MLKYISISIFLFQLINIYEGEAHLRLMFPESRATRWRFNHSAPVNYDDNQCYCGGYSALWYANKGKCGICGDDYRMETPRPHELHGIYGEGVVVHTYDTELLNISTFVTANHKGYLKFDLCNLDKDGIESEDCFESLHILEHGDRYMLPKYMPGWFNTTAIVPNKNFTCEHCVLRMKYIAGNNWGYCKNGEGKLGCGPQEEFRACADISIVN